jgi:hypothetical protein
MKRKQVVGKNFFNRTSEGYEGMDFSLCIKNSGLRNQRLGISADGSYILSRRFLQFNIFMMMERYS